MAVVKNNYIPRGNVAFVKAKRTLLYNETRKGQDHEKIILSLFNHTGQVSEAQALQFLHNKPKGWYYWRIMISPDPGVKEDGNKDLDMRELTRKTILSIETYVKMEGQIDFVAALHTDRAHRHVHAIIYLPRLTPEQFKALSYTPRYAATEEALSQREVLALYRENAQSLFLAAGKTGIHHVDRESRQKRDFPKTRRAEQVIGVAGGRAIQRKIKILSSCSACNGQSVMVRNGKFYCLSCKKVQEQSRGLSR